MKRIKIEFEFDGNLTVKASAKSINAYYEAEDFKLSVYDEDGEFAYPDYISMCEIEETALEMLHEVHFLPEVV